MQDARTHGMGLGHASVDVDAAVGPIRGAVHKVDQSTASPDRWRPGVILDNREGREGSAAQKHALASAIVLNVQRL
jgi:hypothetical protein